MKVTIEHKRGVGRPPSDPFRPQLKHGVAHTYTKNIPLKDWENFKHACRQAGISTRWALIRFVQELPKNHAGWWAKIRRGQ